MVSFSVVLVVKVTSMFFCLFFFLAVKSFEI